MEEHFLNTFFTYTKKDGKKPCLAFFYQGEYFVLPRWWVRSKIKHFALGLFHQGAHENQNLYLTSELSPHRIYAELGGILAGLSILPLPHPISTKKLSELFENYPPHYLYVTPLFLEEHASLLSRQKTLKLLIQEPGYGQSSISHLTFREIFNSGIIHESQYYNRYQTHLKKLGERPITPFDWQQGETLTLKPLDWPSLSQWIKLLYPRQKSSKVKKIWAQLDLSQNTDRAFGLYAPLALGQSCLCLPVQDELPQRLSWDHPHQVYLRPKAWQNLLSKLPPKPKHFWQPWSWGVSQWKYRKIFGKNLQQVWLPFESPLNELKTQNPTNIKLELLPPL